MPSQTAQKENTKYKRSAIKKHGMRNSTFLNSLLNPMCCCQNVSELELYL